MSNEHDNDDVLKDAWRSTQDLRTPESLDNAVLTEARKAAETAAGKPSWPWLRPLAFAATLVVGIVMVYDTQLDDDTAIGPSLQQPPGVELAPATSPEPKAVADEPVEESENRVNLMPEVVAPTSTPRRATPEDVREARERKSEADEMQRQFKASADAAGESLDRFRDLSDDRATGSRAAAPAAAMEEAATEPACDAALRTDAERWWDCVLELREAGRTGDAAREQALLLEAWPRFTVPE